MKFHWAWRDIEADLNSGLTESEIIRKRFLTCSPEDLKAWIALTRTYGIINEAKESE